MMEGMSWQQNVNILWMIIILVIAITSMMIGYYKMKDLMVNMLTIIDKKIGLIDNILTFIKENYAILES